MDIKKYKVIITPTAYKEIYKIYKYILAKLYAENAAKNLMKLVEKNIQFLEIAPKMHPEIKKYDELQRIYRRIVIKNYVILYTIDEVNDVVYVSHIYYGSRNYMDE